MNFKSQIPNLFTLSNLLCGLGSIYLTSTGNSTWAAWLIMFGAGFDFLDGLVARALGVAGELGKQLDSLADVITFGAAPAFIAIFYAGAFDPTLGFSLVAFAPLVMAAFAAYRLGKFNIDTRQSHGFIGVPTPAVAIFWLSFPLIVAYGNSEGPLYGFYQNFLENPVYILITALFWSLMMVSEIPMLALKFKSTALKENLFKYLLIAVTCVLLALLWVEAIPIILLLYLVLSIVEYFTRK